MAMQVIVQLRSRRLGTLRLWTARKMPKKIDTHSLDWVFEFGKCLPLFEGGFSSNCAPDYRIHVFF